MKTTVSRRQMLASVPAAALGSLPATAWTSADDPVFAAIARHREATQALSAAHEPSDALVTRAVAS